MPRNRIIFASLIIPCLLFSQDIDEAIRLFNSFQFSRAKEIFYELKKDSNHPRISEVYYYLGRLSLNPDSATHYYYRVVNDHPQSRYADISYLEIAKINIARKNFANAVTILDRLLKKYPESEYRDEIMFWQGISLIGVDKTKEGEDVLSALQSSYPKSVWSERAANITPQKDVTQEYYAIQLGSYRSKENAEKYAASLRDKGLEVRVVEATVKGKTYYRVWTGRFLSLEQAKEHMLKLDSLGLKGNVVRGS